MRFSLRNGGGIVFLLMTLITALVVASMFIEPVEAMVKSADGEVSAGELINSFGHSQEAESAINWILSGEKEGEYLLREKPALLSCIMLILLMLLPYLVCFGAFNQMSSDIANKGLRFLLLRTERLNIYLGRMLGTVLFCLATVVVSVFLLVIYIQFKLGIYEGIDLWLWSLQGGIAYFMLCLPIVALCAWLSSSIDSPFGSLVLCLLTVGLPGVFLMLLNRYMEDGFLDKLWPTGWKFGMLNSHFGTVCLTGLVLSLFTIGFLMLGLRGFQKRDL